MELSLIRAPTLIFSTNCLSFFENSNFYRTSQNGCSSIYPKIVANTNKKWQWQWTAKYSVFMNIKENELRKNGPWEKLTQLNLAFKSWTRRTLPKDNRVFFKDGSWCQKAFFSVISINDFFLPRENELSIIKWKSKNQKMTKNFEKNLQYSRNIKRQILELYNLSIL